MLCLSAQGSWLSVSTHHCVYVSLTTELWVCQGLLSLWLSLPLEHLSSLCLFSPHLRMAEGSFSFCTCSLLSHQLAFKDQTLSPFHFHLDRSLTTLCFVHILFFPPFLIPTSSSLFGIITLLSLTLNFTPCCPPAHLFSPCQSLLSSRPLPPSFVSSLQGEPQWDWEAETE